MKLPLSVRPPFIAALVVASSMLPIGGAVASSGATPSMPSLIARALHNTNSVRTLAHRDHSVLTTPLGTVTARGQSTEDEVHQRKHLQESIAVAITGADNKVRRQRYTVELIFVPGFTYYRTSLAPRWSRQAGGAYADPYTGGWEQGRTTVTLPQGSRFRGTSTRGGQTQAHFTFANHTAKGSLDLWIAGRGTPYVVREEEALYAVSGPSGNEHLRIDFSSFNRPISIVPPR